MFGAFDLRLDGAQLPAIESARARSLLGYLLLHADSPHLRQRLAFLLWPDSTEGQARTNLRNLLHTVRRASPEIAQILDVGPSTLQLRRDVSCWIDVAVFVAVLKEADAAEAGSDSTISALRTAVELYAGDLLEDCYDEWLVEPREHLRARHLAAMHRLAEALAQRGEYAEAIRVGRELMRADPLNEEICRLLMSVHGAAGDRAGAVRLYHECAAMLQRELSVEPSPTTRNAYAELTRAEQPGIDAGGANRPRGASLVGRDAEWEQLKACWHRAEAGRSQLVVVTGEAGVGKTRLVEELSAWCVHRGAAVAEARAYPTEGDLGYGTVISWLRTPGLADQLRRSDASRSELGWLLPELGLPGDVIPGPADAAELRRRLFDAAASALTSAGRPTLLIADDAQWSDQQSLQLMHYLLRAKAQTPLLVVATVRREEIDDDHPLAELVGALQVLDRITEIHLERLSRAATESLARELIGDQITAGHLARLYAETEGNPLFVVETIRAGPGVAPVDGQGDRPALSPKLHAVISARLRHLSAPARDLVGVAATIGRAFTPDLLALVARADDLALVGALDELWRRGVICEHGRDAYDFSHGKIRDVAYDGLSPATRRHTHLLVAQAIRDLHRSDLEAVSGQVAGHYDRGGDIDQAVTWYVRAAREAQRLFANVDAVRLLERAHALVVELPGDVHRRQELAVLSAVPPVLVNVESFASEKLEFIHRRALEVAADLGVELEPSVLRSMVLSSLCRNEFDEGRVAAQRLQAAARRAGDQSLGIESEYLLGITAFWSGELQTARRYFEHVVHGFSPEQRGAHLLRFGQDPAVVCLSRLANTLWFLGEDEAARRARDDAVALAIEVGHPASRDTVNTFAILLSLDLDERDRARHYVAAVSTRDDQSRTHRISSVAYASLVDVLDGRVTEGIAGIRRALDLCGPRNHAPGYRTALMRVLLAAHVIVGDPASGLGAAEEMLRLDGTRLWEAEARRVRAEFLSARGAGLAEVAAELDRAAEVARLQGARGPERRIERVRARLIG